MNYLRTFSLVISTLILFTTLQASATVTALDHFEPNMLK